jgi:glutamate/tyrosine decarboxylase-like PLP-dependent enzyme
LKSIVDGLKDLIVSLTLHDMPIDAELRRSLEAAHRIALSHLDNLDGGSVAATANSAALRQRLGKPLPEAGTPPEQVVTELADAVEAGLHGSAGGRFFAFVIGGALPAALAADWLTSAWDQNAAQYSASPAASVVEEIAGAWLKDILGLPPEASFALVSGCQMAHVTCLASARHALLQKCGWDVEKQGLYGAPPIRILSTQLRHGSIDRAVRFLGLGTSQITSLSVDSFDRVRPDDLARELERAAPEPTIVVLQAGEINTGAYDAFETIIPLAQHHAAWVHIDGAIGLWAAASPSYRHLVKGIENADSWATDGHKWLNLPFDCGYAFVADSESHRASMAYRADYLTYASDARDQCDWNPEWSRRARGFPTYAALRQLGTAGVSALVERCCQHCYALVTRIGSLPGAEILWEPQINQGLVGFLSPLSGASTEDHGRWTDQVIAEIAASGEAFFSGTTWRGRRAMRVSVSNWRTSTADVDRVVGAVARILRKAAQ